MHEIKEINSNDKCDTFVYEYESIIFTYKQLQLWFFSTNIIFPLTSRIEASSRRHKNLHDGVSDLESKAFTPTYVCDDPKIYTCLALH